MFAPPEKSLEGICGYFGPMRELSPRRVCVFVIGAPLSTCDQLRSIRKKFSVFASVCSGASGRELAFSRTRPFCALFTPR